MSEIVARLYRTFPKFLESKGLKEKIAVLILAGKIEDYLVQEFVYHVHSSHLTEKGSRIFAVPNITTYARAKDKGHKEKAIVDLCLLSGESWEEADPVGLIEAKYLRNRHKCGVDDAKDENSTARKQLKKQLSFKPVEFHFRKNKPKPTPPIYGLVFASYVKEQKTQKDMRAEFFEQEIETVEREMKKEQELHLMNYDKTGIRFDSLFEDQPVSLFNQKFEVTLRVGLWRSSE